MSDSIKRWECCLEIVNGKGKPIDELLLTNIQAKNYNDANNIVVGRGMEYVRNGNYAKDVCVKVRALYEEGSVPITVAKPFISTDQRRYSHGYSAYSSNQSTVSTYKPFSCPLPSLCKNTRTAMLEGTSAIFIEETNS